MSKVTPQMGGCWFCHTDDEPLFFEYEFDTNVHLDCIRKELLKEPDHCEATLMRYLLK